MGTASAEVLFHVLNDLSPARLWIFEKQSVASEDHTRCAEATLHSSVFHKGFLDGMEFFVGGKPLNGDYFFSGDAFDRELAGSNGFFIDNDSADAALIVAAAEFCAGQAQVSAQHPKERSLAICGDADRAAVELKTNGLLHRNPLSGSERSILGRV